MQVTMMDREVNMRTPPGLTGSGFGFLPGHAASYQPLHSTLVGQGATMGILRKYVLGFLPLKQTGFCLPL